MSEEVKVIDQAKKEISRISDTALKTMRNSSAYSLPNTPANSGMKAAQTKPKFYDFALSQNGTSLFTEINRIVAELNAVFNAYGANFEIISTNIESFKQTQEAVNKVVMDGGLIPATIDTLGAVKVGDGLVVTNDGEISIDQEEMAQILDERVLKEEGKSLIDDELIEFAQDEYEKVLNLIEIPNGATSSSNCELIGILDTYNLENKTLTLSGTFTKSGTNVVHGYGGLILMQSDTNVLQTTHYATNYDNAFWRFEELTSNLLSTFTMTKRFLLFVTGGTGLYSTFNYTFENLMLNEGSTALPYQPYNASKHITNYEANFLKEESLKSANLLDLKSINFTGDTYVVNEQTEKDLTLYSYGNNWTNANFIINLEPNTTYTISATIENPNSLNCGFRVTDINANQLAVACKTDSEFFMDFIFTTTESTQYEIQFYLNWAMSGQGTVYYKNVMLNKGSTALPYQEYQGDIVHKAEFESRLKELGFKEGAFILASGSAEVNSIKKCGKYVIASLDDLSEATTVTIPEEFMPKLDYELNVPVPEFNITITFSEPYKKICILTNTDSSASNSFTIAYITSDGVIKDPVISGYDYSFRVRTFNKGDCIWSLGWEIE